MSHLKIVPSTCARHGGKHPALAVTDGAALTPLPQDIASAAPLPWNGPVGVLVPRSHEHAGVVVAVDLWTQSMEDGETGGQDGAGIECSVSTGTPPLHASLNVA